LQFIYFTQLTVFRYLIVCSQLVILMMFTIGFICCFYITVDNDLASIKFIFVIHCIILLLSFCNIVWIHISLVTKNKFSKRYYDTPN
jgi:hypothetical protein